MAGAKLPFQAAALIDTRKDVVDSDLSCNLNVKKWQVAATTEGEIVVDLNEGRPQG